LGAVEGDHVRRAVLVTATETEPRKYGKPVVIGGILDHLCDRLGPQNVHVILIGPPGVDRPDVAYDRLVLERPGSARQVVSVLRHVVLPPGRGAHRHPLQEAVLFSPALAGRLAAAIAAIDPDLEVWDTVRMGQYLELPADDDPARGGTERESADGRPRRQVRRILYADDLFSERYAALLAETGDGDGSGEKGNPGGEFARLLPRPAARLLASPRVHRPLLRLERHLVADSERRQPGWFDATYLISPEETARLRERVPDAEIGTLPPLLPEPRSPAGDRHYTGSREFVFVGGFDYAPNRDGLDWFLRTCAHAVRSRVPGVTITVEGPGTERGLDSASGWGSAVRFRGWVEDLDGVLAGCAALLSPLRTGSGVKIKVLEALSRGLPVIATPAGVGGVAAGPERGCLVGATPAELADAMARAVDPDVNRRLSAAARRAWDSTYAPAVVRRRYDEVFGLS
jgi:glycosyltransferase involved in cell wall biosynthesis